MTEIQKDIRTIDFSKIKLNGFVDLMKIEEALIQLKEIKILVDELLDIRDNYELPTSIIGKINSFNDSILSLIFKIESKETGSSSEVIARKKDMLIKEIISFCINSLDFTRPNSNQILQVYAIAKSFVKPDNIDEKIKEYETNLSKNIIDSNTIVKEISIKKEESETILNELKKKSSGQTVSDYAIVFQENAKKHKDFSLIWLISGIILSVIFISSIFYIAEKNLLTTEIFNEEGQLIRYDFTNLVTKVLIIAVIIFLMSFSFKQYSINRHLQTLNTQRQNALNSYKLFTASISTEDSVSRNALMIQVAKAIFEPQPTGFLSEKGQQVNSGLVEITKLIGQNSN